MSSSRKTLADLRLERGLNQSQCGVSRPMVSLLERGVRRPGPRVISKLAAALQLDPTVVYAACTESARRASAVQVRRQQRRASPVPATEQQGA